MAYYRIDPFGTERGDLQAGIVASTIANVYRKKGATPATPNDFRLKFEGMSGRRSAKDIFSMVKTWALAQGAKVKKK